MKKLMIIIAIPLSKEVEAGDIVKSKTITNPLDMFVFVSKDWLYVVKGSNNFIDNWVPQQLLLLSDEEIKENDWFSQHITIKNVTRCASLDKNFDLSDLNNCKNISLPKKYHPHKILASYPKLDDNLPVFSIDFVKQWINNPVEQIEVEYENTNHNNNAFSIAFNNTLKLSSNNEAICNIPIEKEIDKTKDELNKKRDERTYTEKEVKKLIKEYYENADEYIPSQVPSVNKWLRDRMNNNSKNK